MARLGYIQVTRRCNQACRFCSNPPIEVDLSLEGGRRLVDDLVERGYDGVIFTGGEPTLSPLLPRLIRHALARGIAPRIVTNGQLIGADGKILGRLLRAGLRHVHLSLYSHRAEVVAALTGKEDSLAMALKALDRIGTMKDRITLDVNIVINHYNADHLDGHVAFILDRFPFIPHVVFNNLDPFMNRVAENPDTVPALREFELSLHRALTLLEGRGRTFRVERVPLCYMTAFAHASTETRKIVKDEERIVHFLDEKGMVRQKSRAFVHGKTEACRVCRLDPICAGLDGIGEFFDPSALYPVFVDPGPIIERIKKS